MKIKLPSWCILHSAYLLVLSWPSRACSFSSLLSVSSILLVILVSCLIHHIFGYCSVSKINFFDLLPQPLIDWFPPPSFQDYRLILDFPWLSWVTSSRVELHWLMAIHAYLTLTLFKNSYIVWSILMHPTVPWNEDILAMWTGEYSVTIQSKYPSRHDKMILKCCLLSLNWLFCLRKKKIAV